jgi:hypothetical protein
MLYWRSSKPEQGANMKRMIVVLLFLMSIAAFAQQGIIREAIGTVELKQPGAAEFVLAKVGDPVVEATIVSTGFKSRALISVGNSTIAVQPLTRLSLTEITTAQQTERVAINLSTGRVRADVNPPLGGKTDFSVQSPMVTASVRGTIFEFDTMNLMVFDGTVAFAGSRGRPMLVGAGNTSTVDTVSGRVADPLVTAAAQLLPPSPVGTSTENRPASESIAPSQEVEFTVTTGY